MEDVDLMSNLKEKLAELPDDAIAEILTIAKNAIEVDADDGNIADFLETTNASVDLTYRVIVKLLELS